MNKYRIGFPEAGPTASCRNRLFPVSFAALAIAALICLAGCVGKVGTNPPGGGVQQGPVSPFPWAGQVVEAPGRGTAPANVGSEAQRALVAKQAAKAAAIAAAKKQVFRVSVTDVQSLGVVMAQNLAVKRAVEKHLQSARIVSEQEIEPGVYEVRVQLPLAPVAEILEQNRITPENVPEAPVVDQHVPRQS